MVLKSLEEHNEEMRKRYKDWFNYPKPNGLACPKCGEELIDSDAVTLSSYPPRKNIHCSICPFKGSRIS